MAFVPIQPNIFGAGHNSPPPPAWNQQGQGGYDQQTMDPHGNNYSDQYGYNMQSQPMGYTGGNMDGNMNYNNPYPNSMPSPAPNNPPYPSNYINAPQSHGSHMGGSNRGYSSPPISGNPSPSPSFGAFFGGPGGVSQFDALANPLAQMGMAHASQFVTQVSDGFVARWTGSLRYYFSVNNSFVLSKLKIILCPFLHKSWSRRIVPAADHREMYLPPNQDVNAPDLYIPTMAFITYILLISLIMATSTSGFKPDMLGVTASSGFITLFIEVLMIKLIFYLLSYPPVLLLDLVAYCGYKFVGIVLILLSGWILGSVGFIVSYLLFALFMAVFMVKTLRLIVPQPLETVPRNVRNYALISIALMQCIFTGILCWMGSTSSANQKVGFQQQQPQPTISIPSSMM